MLLGRALVSCVYYLQEPLLRRVQAVTTRPLRLDAVRPEYHRATLHWRPGGDGKAGERAIRSCCRRRTRHLPPYVMPACTQADSNFSMCCGVKLADAVCLVFIMPALNCLRRCTRASCRANRECVKQIRVDMHRAAC